MHGRSAKPSQPGLTPHLAEFMTDETPCLTALDKKLGPAIGGAHRHAARGLHLPPLVSADYRAGICPLNAGGS